MPDLSCLAETDYELINLKKTQLKQMDAEVTLSTSQTGSLQEDYIAILDKGLPSFYRENSREDEYFKKEKS